MPAPASFQQLLSSEGFPTAVIQAGHTDRPLHGAPCVATEARTLREVQRERESLLLQWYILMLSDAVGKALTSYN